MLLYYNKQTNKTSALYHNLSAKERATLSRWVFTTVLLSHLARLSVIYTTKHKLKSRTFSLAQHGTVVTLPCSTQDHGTTAAWQLEALNSSLLRVSRLQCGRWGDTNRKEHARHTVPRSNQPTINPQHGAHFKLGCAFPSIRLLTIQFRRSRYLTAWPYPIPFRSLFDSFFVFSRGHSISNPPRQKLHQTEWWQSKFKKPSKNVCATYSEITIIWRFAS